MARVSSDLVRRARAGERQALVELVETCQGQVYGLALALMRNPTDAADVTQETFVRLLRALPSYRGDGANFATWLRRVTMNISLDHLRRRGHALASIDETDDPVSHDVWQEPAWRAEWAESTRELGAALAELSEPQRAALTLHYLEDSSYDDVARRLGLPLNTVKSHILRGKERMARLLESHRGARRLAAA